MTPAGKRLCRVCRQNADALEFPEGSPAALRKVFAALARKRPWASLRSQGGVGWGSVRRQLVGMGRCGRCGVWCACALERVVEVWCAQGRVDSAGRRRSCAGDARCTAVMPVKCAGCFAPWWRCSSVAWRPQCPFVIVSGGGLEGHCSAASILSTRRLAQATALGLGGRGRLFYRGIFLKFSSFQSASGLTAAALAIDLSGRMSSGR